MNVEAVYSMLKRMERKPGSRSRHTCSGITLEMSGEKQDGRWN